MRLPRCLLRPADFSVLLVGSGNAERAANIWVGANVLGFGVAWVQFPLIRALLSPSAVRASGNGGICKNGRS